MSFGQNGPGYNGPKPVLPGEELIPTEVLLNGGCQKVVVFFTLLDGVLLQEKVH